MSDPTEGTATHEDLSSVPEAGEIIDGELIATSEPWWKQHLAATLLDDMLAPFYLKEGHGPGGWVVLLSPKIALGENRLVPAWVW